MEKLGDNKTSFTLTKDSKSQNYIKYMDMMHHYILELVEKGKLGVEWIHGSSMLVNGLTKALLTGFFEKG